MRGVFYIARVSQLTPAVLFLLYIPHTNSYALRALLATAAAVQIVAFTTRKYRR